MAKEETKVYIIDVFKIPSGISLVEYDDVNKFIEESTKQNLVFSMKDFIEGLNEGTITTANCIIRMMDCKINHPFVSYVLIDSITITLLNTESWFKKEAIKMPKEERYFIPEDRYIKFLEGLC